MHGYIHNTALHSVLDVHVLHKVNVAMEFGFDTHMLSHSRSVWELLYISEEKVLEL